MKAMKGEGRGLGYGGGWWDGCENCGLGIETMLGASRAN